MNLFIWSIVGVICFVMFRSIIEFIQGERTRGMQESRFSKELFYTLLVIYLIVLVGFGLIYFILSLQQEVLFESAQELPRGIIEKMLDSIYFSGVTLLTIGYGDISPLGVARGIALVQALVGYVLPTAFVLRIVQNRAARDRL
ncbi:potassium channel family protein [Aciduricibacillus chroicocephali]|uniref:Potassium channel family protein n=1 Tax=Aciduricibacillus chroicocephali TaxID=3054939 RepID=A0ABY9KXC2_9BACI|nr:potassium channel family protein [Bacillaceae bacterium 44XB]